MTKSPLLPKDYTDTVTRATLFYALKTYENPGSGDAANPQVKWDLHKAWSVAEEALAHSHWQHNSSHALEAGDAEYELQADTDDEIARANSIIAGIIAYQIVNPEEKIAIRRIEHKKGGEMSLVISSAAAEALKQAVPALQFPASEYRQESSARKFMDYFRFAKK